MSVFVPSFYQDSPFFVSIESFAHDLNWLDWPESAGYHAQLNALGASVDFVADNAQQNYELGIALSGQVPTRVHNWHDYFNALCWCAFPQIKKTFNHLHRAHWHDDGRTRPRDGLTLLDESGVIVASDDAETLDRIRRMAWTELFVEFRNWTGEHLRVFVIGHGLMEKCLHPYIGMTAHAYLLSCTDDVLTFPDNDFRFWLDTQVSQQLMTAGSLSPAQLFPLPLLGLPGWWAANESAAFYDNKNYFRSSRRRQSSV